MQATRQREYTSDRLALFRFWGSSCAGEESAFQNSSNIYITMLCCLAPVPWMVLCTGFYCGLRVSGG